MHLKPTVAKILPTVLLLLVAISPCRPSEILAIFSHPGKSHFDFFRPLLIGLAQAGHNLTVVSYFPSKEPIVNYKDLVLEGMPIFENNVNLQDFSDKPIIFEYKIPTFFMVNSWGHEACKIAFNSEIIKKLVRDKPKYDAIILEMFNNDCMMAIAHQLGSPAIIGLSSCAIFPYHYRRLGLSPTLSHTPMVFLPYNDDMGLLQRINNFLHFHATNLLYSFLTQKQTNALIEKYFGNEVPSIEQLVNNISVMLINQHFSLTGTYAYTPNVVEVGGLQIQSEKPLDKQLQNLLDKSTKGVIYISFGTMIRADTLPVDKRNSLLKSIEQFPEYTFLMKWSNESLPNKPKNLITYHWLPQRDILCHPNIKLFMSHGGLLGTSEAAFCAVPMLVTPFYGDQFLNAAAIERQKLGIILKYSDFSERNIVSSMKRLLHEDFAKSAMQLSYAFRHRPQDPLDLAIWWVEHAIATKGANLGQQAMVMNSNWFIDSSCDVCLVLVALLLAIIFVIYITLKKLFNLIALNLRKLLKQMPQKSKLM